MPKSAADVADKWARRLGAATEDIRKGVEAVTDAPSKKAIAKKEKFRANLLKAIDEGKWDAALGKYTLEQWKKDMAEKAISVIPSRATAAKDKMTDFFNQLLPYEETLKSRIAAMPDVTLEDNINRAVTWIREMSKFRKK